MVRVVSSAVGASVSTGGSTGMVNEFRASKISFTLAARM